MNIECSIALDALALVFMLLMLLTNPKSRNKWDRVSYHFTRLVSTICLFLLLDLIYVSLYASFDPAVRGLMLAVKSLYFIANSLIVWLWVGYIDLLLFGENYKKNKCRWVYSAMLFLDIGLVLVNFFSGWMFDISAQGIFQVKLVAMWVFTGANYLSVILAAVVLIKNRGLLDGNDFIPLILFAMPPFFGEIVQILFKPCSLICSYAVSALMVFQVSQKSDIYTDELTGLANRRMINERAHEWFSESRGLTICGIMIDLDGLKQTNDKYGHSKGDQVLISLGSMLQEIKRRGIVRARYGGDEFVMIWRTSRENDSQRVEKALYEIRDRVNSFRAESDQVEFSLGRFECSDKSTRGYEDFFKEMDDRMYINKSEKLRK